MLACFGRKTPLSIISNSSSEVVSFVSLFSVPPRSVGMSHPALVRLLTRPLQASFSSPSSLVALSSTHSRGHPHQRFVSSQPKDAPEAESELARRYRELREDTWTWSHNFWKEHNEQFVKQKREFAKSTKSEDDVDATEMSVFYKEFLDARWSAHLNYNKEWQKRNFAIMWLSFRLNLENLTKRK